MTLRKRILVRLSNYVIYKGQSHHCRSSGAGVSGQVSFDTIASKINFINTFEM